MKRKREASDEPPPRVVFPPSSATVLLDSKQNGYYNLGSSTIDYTNAGLSYGGGEGLPDVSPVGVGVTVGGNSRSTRVLRAGNRPDSLLSGDNDSMGGFTAAVNPMTGCDRSSYHGSFGANDEWDIHRGNSLFIFRVMMQALPSGGSVTNVFDLFFKMPDAHVFLGSPGKTQRQLTIELAAEMTFLINNRTMRADNLSSAEHGWSVWNHHTLFMTTGKTEPVFKFDVTTGGRLVLNMRLTSDTVTADWENSPSTFFVMDHPNSLTCRGGFWSGFGHINPTYSKPNVPFGSKPFSLPDRVGENSARFKTTPFLGYQGFWGLSYKTLPDILLEYYADVAAQNSGEVTGVVSADLRKEMNVLFMGQVIADVIGSTGIQYGNNFGFGSNQYVATRRPLFKDSRYFIHNSDEMSFDRKLIPFTGDSLVAPVGPDTIGVDFREYGENMGRVWRDTPYEGTRFNPNLHLAKNASLMHLEIQTFNEYGEEIKPSLEGVASGTHRNLLVGEAKEAVMDSAGTDPYRYQKYLYPNVQIDTDAVVPTSLATANYPPWAYYDLSFVPINFPMSFNDIDSEEQRPNLLLPLDGSYVDNFARAGVGSSIAHFFLNELY